MVKNAQRNQELKENEKMGGILTKIPFPEFFSVGFAV